MKRFFIAVLVLFAILVGVGLFSKSTDRLSSSEEKGFKERVLNAIEPTPAAWNQIRFEEIGRSTFRLTLVYRRMPSSLQDVENDTHRIARAVLKVLDKEGRKPSQEMIAVVVHAQIPEKGETDKEMVRYLGKTIYDYNTDQLTFKPAK